MKKKIKTSQIPPKKQNFLQPDIISSSENQKNQNECNAQDNSNQLEENKSLNYNQEFNKH